MPEKRRAVFTLHSSEGWNPVLSPVPPLRNAKHQELHSSRRWNDDKCARRFWSLMHVA